jgi:hypothetical protein
MKLPYFFSSTALSRTEMVTIELRRIYRQADSRFIDLLNQVREDRLDPNPHWRQLNARHIPNFSPAAKTTSTITLCTHNRNADSINASRLAELTEKITVSKPRSKGISPSMLTRLRPPLELKPGAQVMFVRNDLSPRSAISTGKWVRSSHISGKTFAFNAPKTTIRSWSNRLPGKISPIRSIRKPRK